MEWGRNAFCLLRWFCYDILLVLLSIFLHMYDAYVALMYGCVCMLNHMYFLFFVIYFDDVVYVYGMYVCLLYALLVLWMVISYSLQCVCGIKKWYALMVNVLAGYMMGKARKATWKFVTYVFILFHFCDVVMYYDMVDNEWHEDHLTKAAQTFSFFFLFFSL